MLFLLAGAQKLTQSQEAMAKSSFGFYANDFSASFLKLLGVLEVLGGIGVVSPKLTGILPWLIPLAAVGLALIMIGATYTRIRRGENQMAIGTVVCLVMSVFVAYGRFFLDV